MNTDNDVEWLTAALDMATQNVSDGGGPFAALIGRGSDIVATGINRVTAIPDPTAHAEITAIRTAARELGTFSLAGCVLVSSCEPCPMCLFAALWARVDRVVYAGTRDDAAKAGFHDRDLYDMLDQPRDSWAVPIVHVPMADPFAPFAAWLSNSARVEY
jgi:guanine deaminase